MKIVVLYKENFGCTTFLNVSNIAYSDGNITITYNNGSGVTNTTYDAAKIKIMFI